MLVVSLIFVALAVWAAAVIFSLLRDKGSLAKAMVPLLAASIGEFAAMVILSLQLFLIVPALAVIGWICLAAKSRTSTFCFASFAAVTLITLLLGGRDFQTWAKVRREYPLESLAERLAYETDRERSASRGLSSARIKTQAPPLAASFVDLERKVWETSLPMRAATLAHAHTDRVQQFIDSQGFGIGRMPRPSPYYLARSQRTNKGNSGIRIESPPSLTSEPPHGKLAPLEREERSALELEPLHVGAFVDFVNPAGFGWVQDIDHVAGFEPHAFSKLPRLKPAWEIVKERWRTTRLELVSLLKHDRPMVYISDRLPKMDELADAAVRPLDAFERQALTKLVQGESLAIDGAINRIRMLGPILAVEQCQQCHRVERGELLGAFSYEFLRDPPVEFAPQSNELASPEL